MKPLSKVWGVLSIVFTVAVLLKAPALQSALSDVLGENVAAKLISGAVLIAAMAKSLPDRDGDGKPDLFDDDPDTPSGVGSGPEG